MKIQLKTEDNELTKSHLSIEPLFMIVILCVVSILSFRLDAVLGAMLVLMADELTAELWVPPVLYTPGRFLP